MAKKKEIKLPINKKTMNLCQYDYKHDPKREMLIYGAVVLVAVLVLGKFLVLDTIFELNNLQAQNASLQEELIALQTRAADYNKVQENYYRYTNAYSSGEEQLVDRIEITSLIQEKADGLANIVSTSIMGNSVNMQVTSANLDDLKKFREALESSEIVSEVYVHSASRDSLEDSGEANDVTASVAFKCIAKEAE